MQLIHVEHFIIVRNSSNNTNTARCDFSSIRKNAQCDKYMSYTIMASVLNQVKIWLSRAGLVQQQYEVHTKVLVRVSIVRSNTNTARQQATATGQQSGRNSNEHISNKAGGGHRAIIATW